VPVTFLCMSLILMFVCYLFVLMFDPKLFIFLVYRLDINDIKVIVIATKI